MLKDAHECERTEKFQRVLNELSAKTMNGGRLSKDEALTLLILPPDSREAELLGKTARRMAAELTGYIVRMWSDIGVDSRPCAMNCAFLLNAFKITYGKRNAQAGVNEADGGRYECVGSLPNERSHK